MPWKRNVLAALQSVVLCGVAIGSPTSAAGQSGRPEALPPTADRPAPRFELPYAVWGIGAARQLGTTLQELTPAQAAERHLPQHTGLLVDTVRPKSPAETAGLKAGDVILQIAGEVARSIAQFRRVLAETSEGQPVEISVFRDGKPIRLSVVPDVVQDDMVDALRRDLLPRVPRQFLWNWNDHGAGEAVPPETAPRRRPRPPTMPRVPLFEWSPGAGRLGIVVQDLEPQLAAYFGVKAGALVASVTADAPGARAGVKAGDVIVAVNGKTVGDTAGLVRLIQDLPDGQEITLSVTRDKKPLTLKARLAVGKTWHA